MRDARVGIVAAAALLTAACGAGCGGSSYQKAPASAPPAQPASEVRGPSDYPGAAAGAPATPSAEQAQPAPPAAPPPVPAPPPPTATTSPAAAPTPDRDTAGRQAAIRRYAADLQGAQQQLEASMGDCTAACRALGSMERAAGHMCELASATDDRRRCEDAKTRVLAARDRVRTTCGSCPGGPSLEHSAPIPSR